ncbi:MAG: dimethylarginine dimethylaminohydrolase [Proteobacteria bacterium]|nr:dimethylarginine dimethylaminohydrolase [Pseudomonadota bacterium]
MENPMRVFDFTNAIMRAPAPSVVHGLRNDSSPDPDFEKLRAEHRAYVSALRDAGLSVDELPPLDAFPDSIFVEDPTFIVPQGAILLRPGAPSRLSEREHMRDALKRHFGQVHELVDGENADGGDVLITPKTIFIGLSKRTNRAGAEALQAALHSLGRNTRIVQTPSTVLHLKTASSLLDEETILVTRAMAQSKVFDGFRLIVTPDGEEAAANALRINGTILLGDRFPRTAELIRGRRLSVQTMPVTEVAKLDAGLSCMSLRW